LSFGGPRTVHIKVKLVEIAFLRASAQRFSDGAVWGWVKCRGKWGKWGKILPD